METKGLYNIYLFISKLCLSFICFYMEKVRSQAIFILTYYISNKYFIIIYIETLEKLKEFIKVA